jgi:hypothetical protein
MQVIPLIQHELAERWRMSRATLERWRNATPYPASPPSRRSSTRCTWNHSIFFDLARRRDDFQANFHPLCLIFWMHIP